MRCGRTPCGSFYDAGILGISPLRARASGGEQRLPTPPRENRAWRGPRLGGAPVEMTGVKILGEERFVGDRIRHSTFIFTMIRVSDLV